MAAKKQNETWFFVSYSLILLICLFSSSCSSKEERDWRKVNESKTVSALQEFTQKYPESPYCKEACSIISYLYRSLDTGFEKLTLTLRFPNCPNYESSKSVAFHNILGEKIFEKLAEIDPEGKKRTISGPRTPYDGPFCAVDIMRIMDHVYLNGSPKKFAHNKNFFVSQYSARSFLLIEGNSKSVGTWRSKDGARWAGGMRTDKKLWVLTFDGNLHGPFHIRGHSPDSKVEIKSNELMIWGKEPDLSFWIKRFIKPVNESKTDTTIISVWDMVLEKIRNTYPDGVLKSTFIAHNSSRFSFAHTEGNTSIVKDTETGLEWMNPSHKPDSWQAAVDYCETLSHGGYSDWRLPALNELSTLRDQERYKPATVFPVIGSDAVWSSDRWKHLAYLIDFTFGEKIVKRIKEKKSSFLCIRGYIGDK